MSKTVVRKNESLDDALRRFKRSVTKAGTLQEARKREHYEKPSVKRKRKSEAARKRKKILIKNEINRKSLSLLKFFSFHRIKKSVSRYEIQKIRRLRFQTS